MSTLLGVALASAVGAMLRYAAEVIHARRRTRKPGRIRRVDLPWATLTVNVVASALLGAVLALAVHDHLSATMRVVLGAGLAGGLSTFSTFAVDTVQLATHDRRRLAGGYLAVSLLLGVAAAAAAYRIALSW